MYSLTTKFLSRYRNSYHHPRKLPCAPSQSAPPHPQATISLIFFSTIDQFCLFQNFTQMESYDMYSSVRNCFQHVFEFYPCHNTHQYLSLFVYSIVWHYHGQSIHSPIAAHLSCSQYWAVMNEDTTNKSYGEMFLFLLVNIQQQNCWVLGGCMSSLKATVKTFSKVDVPFCTPTNEGGEIQLIHNLVDMWWDQAFKFQLIWWVGTGASLWI